MAVQRRQLGEGSRVRNPSPAEGRADLFNGPDRELMRGVALGYTLATGRLFADFGEFHTLAEKILGRPVFTHEMGVGATWVALQERFEDAVLSETGETGAARPRTIT